MPFIDSKITVSLTPEKEEAIKTKLGEAIQILNKSETYLMVGLDRKSTRLNSSHYQQSRMPSSA